MLRSPGTMGTRCSAVRAALLPGVQQLGQLGTMYSAFRAAQAPDAQQSGQPRHLVFISHGKHRHLVINN